MRAKSVHPIFGPCSEDLLSGEVWSRKLGKTSPITQLFILAVTVDLIYEIIFFGWFFPLGDSDRRCDCGTPSLPSHSSRFSHSLRASSNGSLIIPLTKSQ